MGFMVLDPTMTEDTRLMASLKKVKNIRQYVFSGRTARNVKEISVCK